MTIMPCAVCKGERYDRVIRCPCTQQPECPDYYSPVTKKKGISREGNRVD